MAEEPIAQIIKETRKRRRCSQAAFGDWLGVSSQTVWFWEHSIGAPRIERAQDWAGSNIEWIAALGRAILRSAGLRVIR